MPTKKAKNPPARKPSRLRQAAKQVAVDADQVRQDLGKLLLSLEDLSVEALKEVSDRALELIAEKSGVDKRSMIWRGDWRRGEHRDTVAGLFAKSKPVSETSPRTS